jgi:hypothetical protein
MSVYPPAAPAWNALLAAKAKQLTTRYLHVALPVFFLALGLSSACAQTSSKLLPVPAMLAGGETKVPTEPLSAGPVAWQLLGEHIYTSPGSDGLYHVAYALVFSSEYYLPVTLSSIQVLDPDKDFQPTGTNLMLSINNENITDQVRLFSLPQTYDAANFSMQLGPGQGGVVYFDVTYPNRDCVPAHLSHRVVANVTTSAGQTVTFTVIDDPLAVIRRQPAVLQPPFRGKGWLNANGCCRNLGAHRASFNPINGKFWQSEAFAIDFTAVNAEGIGHSGDGSQLDQYPYYGTELLAVRAGKVVEVVTDQPDQIPNQEPVGITIENAAGNHVILDLGDDQYALYAHLKPYSATVQVGDTVQAGQKLGLLGNSGSSTGPHLHFQLMDRPSALKANGIPFVFDNFVLAGTVTESVLEAGNDFSAGKPLPIKPVGKAEQDKMPLALDIINIP